jgi:processive 1,2-diacylglycerol beta-glucosyltransferase
MVAIGDGMNRKILILHAAAGAGHKRAAEAVAAAMKIRHPSVEVVVRDVLEFTPSPFQKTYADGYLRVVRTVPELWGYMYNRSDRRSRQPWRKVLRSVFNAANTPFFDDYMREQKFDAVICTHFMPLEMLSTLRKRKKITVPFFGCVTDFAVHSLWIVDRVDGYFVATDEAARQLTRRGQAKESIAVTGIPIDPVFSQSTDRAAVRKEFELRDNKPVILSLSGGMGVGPTVEFLKGFKDVAIDCQLMVVAGANEELKNEAEAVAATLQIPVRILGFTKRIHDLMGMSDLVVSKPGGLTSSESLAKGLPMLIIEPIPGQEQRNCEVLLEAGAAARLFEIEDGPAKIAELLADPGRLQTMKERARAVAHPNAAFHVVDGVMNRLG